ncbi:hypothetical protein DMN91_010592 [Ooceraea biroi]|uniref:Uncharacterized protein n=1 Tax=Ooceraea biroi TaxID=2015173 RepID=A0A026W8E4_OOCBI|nr:uncharacterized protein LOC105282944 [Ooceraea biroi]EZA51294.1 hypothetical protein X777_09972 [Ooceraea biroi]RLU16524.1 hypothetical protein DMN91_010592 [Ooceraea biroi]
MKLYWVILFGFAISIAAAGVIINTETFDFCQPGSWILTNTTITWSNDTNGTNGTYQIVGNITFSQCLWCQIYTIHVIITGCKNQSACMTQPMGWVEQVDCNSENLTNSDLEACMIAQEVAKLEQERKYLIRRYGRLFAQAFFAYEFCIDLANINLNSDGESNESNGSNESGNTG